MSEHYNKVRQTATEAFDKYLQLPIVLEEVARVRKLIENVASKGGFQASVKAKISDKYTSYVKAVFTKEGYGESSNRPDFYFITWK